MSKICKVIIFFLVMVTLLIPSYVNADTHSYYWHSDCTYYISYTSVYFSATTSAISDWNSALDSIGSSIDITYSPTPDISFSDSNHGATGWAAQTTTSYSPTSYDISYLNLNY